MQRRLPDRNNLGYVSTAYASEAGKKEVICKTSLLFAGNLPQSLWAKLQILHSGLIMLCVHVQERTELKGFKIVHTAPDENKDRDCEQE